MEIMIKTDLRQIVTQCTGTQDIIKKLASLDPCGRKRGLKTVAFLLLLRIYSFPSRFIGYLSFCALVDNMNNGLLVPEKKFKRFSLYMGMAAILVM